MKKLFIICTLFLLSTFAINAININELDGLVNQFKQNGASESGVAFLNDEIAKLKAKNSTNNSSALESLKKELKTLSLADKFDKAKYNKTLSKYNRMISKFSKDAEKTLVSVMTKMTKKDREALNLLLINNVIGK